MSHEYSYENISVSHNGRGTEAMSNQEKYAFRYQVEDETSKAPSEILVVLESSGFHVSLVEDGFVVGEIEIDDLRTLLEMRGGE